jgi:hypothetical protein
MDMLIPSSIIIGALASALALPLFLLLFARGPARIVRAGARFKAASLASVVAYLVWCLATLREANAGDLWAGSFIVAGSIVFWFVPWSLLAWGFTLHMLTVLARSPTPLPLDRWIEAYVGGGGAEVFAADRLQVLLRSRMARRANGQIAATRLGRGTAGAARITRALMGLR